MNYSGKYIKRIGVLKNDRGYGADTICYRPDGKQIAVTGGSNPYIYVYDIEKKKRIVCLDAFMKGGGAKISYDGTGRYFIHKGNMVDRSYFGTDYKYYYVVRDVADDYRVIGDKIQPTVLSTALSVLLPYPFKENKIYGPSNALDSKSPKLYIFTLPEMAVTPLAEGHLKIDDFALSPDGRFLVDSELANGFDGKRGLGNTRSHLRIWTFPEMRLIKKVEDAFENDPFILAWTPDGKTLYSCAMTPKARIGLDPNIRKNEVILWDTSNWTVRKRYIRHSGGAKGFNYLPDGKHVFSLGGSLDPVLYLENSLNGNVIEAIELPYSPYVETLEQSPVNPNHFALGFKDEIWLYKIVGLPY